MAYRKRGRVRRGRRGRRRMSSRRRRRVTRPLRIGYRD